ncbi:AcrB/AcrD/AcrF family protein [Sphingomonas sp.]|uniref:AcrB/AcrD/AcrF family protein n=1 Tax=Sphingomonas sp. TaxID=28214 RepID=UPI002FCA7B0E
MAAGIPDSFDRHWRRWLLLGWVLACTWLIAERWNGIHWFALPDTDDNMRIMQVRAWLHGQDWFDLRQHRLNPPFGANIHWSRLVDLPIAGIILAVRPFLGGIIAEKVAVAVAPLLPLLVAMAATSVTMRRLLSPYAYLLALILLMCAHSSRLMWSPLRIDHHGWQLALLCLVMLSFTDRNRARAGLLLGATSALSLTIGLEMLLYLLVAGALTVLLWVRDGDERSRLAAYGASLAGGTALGFLSFASYDNRAAICDALTPVWLSAMVAAGALCVLLAMMPLGSVRARLGAAAGAGLLLAGGFTGSWPQCLGRLEAASPELERYWLDRVREAMPLYRHDHVTIAAVASLPLAGLAGYAAMLWRHRREPERLLPWAALAILCFTATALLLWQSRTGPAAQTFAVPGAVALGWLLVPRAQASSRMLVRVFGTVAAFLIVSGIGAQFALKQIPKQNGGGLTAVSRANRLCPTMPALRPIALQPKGLVLTFVDLGPRLITVTHHDAITGPYHRNGSAILDVHKAFRGSVANAHATVLRRGVDYVLICPNLSEATVYVAEAPKGFYRQLAAGRVPPWLERVPLPAKSPYRMWRVRR